MGMPFLFGPSLWYPKIIILKSKRRSDSRDKLRKFKTLIYVPRIGRLMLNLKAIKRKKLF